MRRFIRHPSEFPIELQEGTSVDSLQQHAKNVSAGGLCCDSSTRLKVGSPVHVRIPVGPIAFESDGTVAWCTPSDRGYEVGIRFTQEEVSASLAMVEQLCRIRRYREVVQEVEGRQLSEEEAAREWLADPFV